MNYIKIESENQKSCLIILVLFHSVCPYKNCLKCFTELQTLFKNSSLFTSKVIYGTVKKNIFFIYFQFIGNEAFVF